MVTRYAEQKVWERNMKLTMRTETRSRIKLGQGLRVNVQLVVKDVSQWEIFQYYQEKK